jgi:hypothetical protein
MFLDFDIGQLAPKCLQLGESPFLISAHEPAISGHIGGKNSGQLAFDGTRGQRGAPQPHGPNRSSALQPHSNGKRGYRHSLLLKPGSPSFATRRLCSHLDGIWRTNRCARRSPATPEVLRVNSGAHHSSGNPALRRPAKYVASNKPRVFGTPHHSPGKVLRRVMLEKRSPPSGLRASASSVAARSVSPLRA